MTTTPKKQPVTGWQRTLVIRIDKLIYKFSRRWLGAFNIIIAIYVGLPILAPVLMNAGLTAPARAIYTVYSPMCHQMASRSYFLFGEQPAYPRELAGTDLQPIEAYWDSIPEFVGFEQSNWVKFTYAARDFLGNEQMGYKMALCERDIAIYGFVLIFGLVYAALRRRIHIKPLPFLVFIIVGMGPIGWDGFSQLFSYWSTPFDGSTAVGLAATIQKIFPLRESTPFLRAFTGALFGFMLAWLAYPHVEGGMRDTANDLERKLRRIEEL
ncbi:MAG: DUF2085 domain-containing protein [Chloroflexi bacterium]|nr:DUF2085 domain-containing protein [Chloroflexota bacterium]